MFLPMSNKLSTIKVTLLCSFNYSKLFPFFVELPQTLFDKKVLYKKLFMLDNHVAQPYTACDLLRYVCWKNKLVDPLFFLFQVWYFFGYNFFSSCCYSRFFFNIKILTYFFEVFFVFLFNTFKWHYYLKRSTTLNHTRAIS